MSKPFRIAIVGTGKIGASEHLPAALAAPGVELAALVDPAQNRAREVAQRFKIKPRLSARVEDVLDETDGAVIATPNHTHAPIALSCLNAGVPVLIEKPLATTVEEGRKIVDAAEDRGVTAAVGYSLRFCEGVVLIHELLQSGFFGRPRRFLCQVGTVGGWAPLSGYNLDRRATGGGVMVLTGAHFVDRMLYWFGYPDDYTYQDDSLGGPEANALATFRYNSGPTLFEGTMRFSKTVKLKAGFVMETEKGTVILQEQARAPVRFRPNDDPTLETILRRREGPRFPPGKSRFLMQLEDFVRACTDGSPPMVSARQGLESLRLIEALYAKRTPL